MILRKKEESGDTRIKFAWFPTEMNSGEIIWWEYYEYTYWWGSANLKKRLVK